MYLAAVVLTCVPRTQALDLLEASPSAFGMEGDELGCALVNVMDDLRAQAVALFPERQARPMASKARMNTQA